MFLPVPNLRFLNTAMSAEWILATFEEIFVYEQPTNYIVSSTNYNKQGGTPVLTANKSFVLGCTEEKEGIYDKGPAVIFDDFTLDYKYVDFKFKIKSSAIKILSGSNGHDAYFGYCLLLTHNFESQGHARHYISLVQKTPCFIPPPEEEKKITTFFKLVDKKIKLQNRKVELLKDYKKGVSKKLLKQCKPTPNAIQESFELRELCEVVSGGTPKTEIERYWDGDIIWFTPTEIGKQKYVRHSRRKITKDGLDSSSARLLPPGTILLTSRATLGEMSITEVECTTNQGFQSLIAKGVLGEFLYYLQPLIKHHCTIYASGSTFLEINKKELGKCRLNIPTLKEQEKIVDILSTVDKIIDNENKMLEKSKILKRGLLQKMFI